MNYERYNLSQLARVTKTNARTLYEWIRLGYLKPCQIAGTRKKYSIENFLAAEKLALQYSERLESKQFFKAEEKKKIIKRKIIPDNFFNHLEGYLD